MYSDRISLLTQTYRHERKYRNLSTSHSDDMIKYIYLRINYLYVYRTVRTCQRKSWHVLFHRHFWECWTTCIWTLQGGNDIFCFLEWCRIYSWHSHTQAIILYRDAKSATETATVMCCRFCRSRVRMKRYMMKHTTGDLYTYIGSMILIKSMNVLVCALSHHTNFALFSFASVQMWIYAWG